MKLELRNRLFVVIEVAVDFLLMELEVWNQLVVVFGIKYCPDGIIRPIKTLLETSFLWWLGMSAWMGRGSLGGMMIEI